MGGTSRRGAEVVHMCINPAFDLNISLSSTGASDAHSTINPTWSGNFLTDEFGEFFVVTCNNNDAKFYLSRFARGSIGRCVLFRGRWITPNEFQARNSILE